MKPSQETYVPSHPALFLVEFGTAEFDACLRAQKPFKPGEVITQLKGLLKSPKAYTSVQYGPGSDDHIELNSDLVFVNHSCEPNVAFDLSSTGPSGWHVRALNDLEVGTPLSFFYPSTEWTMCQPFDCQCGADSCLKRIEGAACLSREELEKRGFINSYIWAMVDNHVKSKAGAEACLSCGYGLSLHGDQQCDCKPC